MIFPGAEARNRMRWRSGKRGHYEGWYCAFSDPEGQRGWWLRYSMRAPTDESQPPQCQVWFMRTNRAAARPNRAVRETFPIEQLSHSAEPFRLDVGPGTLQMGGCRGQLSDAEGDVAWDLEFDSRLPPISPTPEWGARVATCYMEPHPLLAVSGTITENGKSERIDALLGEQAHVFGARHSTRWHWAEGKRLGRDGAAFVGVAAWPSLPGGERSMTSLFLDLGDGRRLLRNRTLAMLRPRTAHSPSGWRFDADYGLQRVSGEVTPRAADLIGVTYHDPSGTPVYCYHSELADLTLRYYSRRRKDFAWNLDEEVVAPGACAFEYGSAQALPDVELLLD